MRQLNYGILKCDWIRLLNHLRRLYQKFNIDEDPRIQATCPKCENKFFVDLVNLE
jgi:hypothetical protein